MKAWKSLPVLGAIACAGWCVTVPAFAVQDVRPDQCVWFAEPQDGAVVGSTFKVRFKVDGMKVMPAGDVVKDEGHHHLLINSGPLEPDALVPYNATSLHFGFGQTEADITLPPGNYTLTAQFGNGNHKSFGPAMSQTIRITVK